MNTIKEAIVNYVVVPVGIVFFLLFAAITIPLWINKEITPEDTYKLKDYL